MNTRQALPCSSGPDHQLEDHAGILHVSTQPPERRVDVDFDPATLSDDQVRGLIEEHIVQVDQAIQRCTYRLEGRACEACAQKLERRAEEIPGVRRAVATYLGKVISVTFDPQTEPPARLANDLRESARANILPLEHRRETPKSFATKLRDGELNDEISCALGLVCMLAALSCQHLWGMGSAAVTLYVLAYFFAGQEGVRSAYESLKERTLDVDVLMVLAALGAGIIGQPFEGALLLFLFSLSNVLQSHAMQRTQRAIESLLSLRPTEALVKRGGETLRVAVEELLVGERVIVKPGEQIPVDGTLVEGSTHVDESSLTGESMPVSKQPGNGLFAGTMNQSGGIEMTVGKRAEDSTLARMVKLVAEAQAEKSATQRFLERAEQHYAAGVILLTALVLAFGYWVQRQPFDAAFFRAMTVMVVASPCALVISTPATVLSAIGGAAKRGLLIKGGSHLERAAKIDIVAVDKTGTLTVGKPSLTHLVTPAGSHPLQNSLPSEAASLLRAAASLEAKSEHPLAHAIVQAAETLQIPLDAATDFQATAGKGAEATIGGKRLLIGSERLFHELNATQMEALLSAATAHQAEGRTCVWLGSREGDRVTAEAVMVMADTLRPEARQLTSALHRLGVKKVVMLTGDQRPVAEAIAREAKVDEVHASLLPEDKLKVIRQLRQEGTVMMVGDGINDAPALAVADIGVAMGAAGTDVAMETADIVLMGDRLENIPLLLAHARRARKVLLQNLAFASAVIVLLILSALGLELDLKLGVIGHEGSTVLVCLNGLRLLRLKSGPAIG